MNELLFPIIYVIVGAALLAFTADMLVKGASALAIRVGVSTLVIGLTVVAFGTSLPELVTSLQGSSAIALGNVTGSNLVNLGLILGLTALICPLKCDSKMVRFELPVMVALGPVFLAVCLGGFVSRTEGVLFIFALAAFLAVSVKRGSIGETDELIEETKKELEKGALSNTRIAIYIVGGLIGLVAGGRFLVTGAISLAEIAGIPERIIALTIVAGGTSLPELATGVAAARRGHADMALGNIVGSNIFNILCIVGICAVVKGPLAVADGFVRFDIPAMIVIQTLCLPLMLSRLRVSRIEGGLLLVSYAIYTVLLFFWK